MKKSCSIFVIIFLMAIGIYSLETQTQEKAPTTYTIGHVRLEQVPRQKFIIHHIAQAQKLSVYYIGDERSAPSYSQEWKGSYEYIKDIIRKICLRFQIDNINDLFGKSFVSKHHPAIGFFDEIENKAFTAENIRKYIARNLARFKKPDFSWMPEDKVSQTFMEIIHNEGALASLKNEINLYSRGKVTLRTAENLYVFKQRSDYYRAKYLVLTNKMQTQRLILHFGKGGHLAFDND